MTQQNASFAQSGASAANALNMQSDELRRSIDVFRLSQ
jgi:methyl-accepting chemotaxis protein